MYFQPLADFSMAVHVRIGHGLEAEPIRCGPRGFQRSALGFTVFPGEVHEVWEALQAPGSLSPGTCSHIALLVKTDGATASCPERQKG